MSNRWTTYIALASTSVSCNSPSRSWTFMLPQKALEWGGFGGNAGCQRGGTPGCAGIAFIGFIAAVWERYRLYESLYTQAPEWQHEFGEYTHVSTGLTIWIWLNLFQYGQQHYVIAKKLAKIVKSKMCFFCKKCFINFSEIIIIETNYLPCFKMQVIAKVNNKRREKKSKSFPLSKTVAK